KTANLNDRLQCIPTVQNKWSLTFANGDVRSLECDASGDSFPRQIDNHDWTAPLTPFDATHAKSGVTSAVIGDCVAGILSDGFNGFTSLSSVTVNPNTMYAYGGYSGMTPDGCCAFNGDYSLVEFPYSSVLESIGRDSFHGCSGLTDATIASSCTYIGDEAFFDCTGLEKVVMEGSTPPALGGDFVFYKIDSNAPSGVSQLDIDIEVPCDAVNTYKTAPRWSAYADRITCQAPPHDYSQDYFTIESTSDNNIISLMASGTGIAKTISASTDNGSTWTAYTSTNEGTPIATLNTGDKVLIKGENSQYSAYTTRYNYFTSIGQFNVYGNIMSLISGDSFENADTLTGTYAFNNLFTNCTGLASAENLILPATTLAQYCYRAMFQGCTSLTTAPELPATTLAQYCYNQMFWFCTNLTTAPELPATTLAQSSYRSMFFGCTSLNYIKCLATDISASNCTTSWVYNVAASGTFVKAASMGSWTSGEYGIPSNWTIQNDDGSPYIDEGGGDNGRVD
ncbi:MAG: leucine-rich repeat protein, partial [Prevotella sp.]|nr:leucine-rich repeat protein [Prevotella sp.]